MGIKGFNQQHLTVIFRFKLTKRDLVCQKSNWSIYSSFAKCIFLSLDFQIESEIVWFNFRGNGTSFQAGKQNKNGPKVAPFVIIKVLL